MPRNFGARRKYINSLAAEPAQPAAVQPAPFRAPPAIRVRGQQRVKAFNNIKDFVKSLF